MREDRSDPDRTELPSTETASPASDDGQIGHYRMLQKVGEGGMGEVWLAEQQEPVKRKVALKIIKQGMDTKQVVARFEAERQALAMMDHPAVAKVFDAGTTPSGRPYFVMEYVKGVSITEHCDRHRLGNRERLELFRQVCEGVQHAHQKAIIHRDLKPSNVLVTEQDGKRLPKIIDFGVAKATAQRLTEKTMFTQLGVLIGTPEYMSPEQAELTGQDVDTRTDVYSLGVMLYELLVGALPFDSKELRSAGFDGIRKKILEQEPPRPSTRLSTMGDRSTESARLRSVDYSTLRRELRGDLDWITMRALEKDRTRRYGSPSELAADVLRHLKHEPVQASPPSVVYRVRKFVRRHRVGVVAATLVLIAMGLGLAGTTVGFLRAVEAREATRREAAVANQVSGFLERLIRGSTPSVARGEEVTVREVLDRGAERIENELKDQPLVQARLMHVMGGAYRSLSLYDEAARLAEQALQIRRDHLGNEHPDTLDSMANLGEIYRFNARPAESRALKTEVYETLRRLHGLEHPRTLDAMKGLASSYIGGRESEEAQALLEEMLPIARRVLGDEHPTTILAMGSLGLQYANTQRYDEAESLYVEQYEVQKRKLGSDHPNTLNTLWRLAKLHVTVGRYDDAEPLCVELLELRRRIQGPDHHQTGVAIVLLADLRRLQGRFDQAEVLYNERLGGCDQKGRSAAFCRADVEGRLGRLYLAVGDNEQAERYLRSSYTRFMPIEGDSAAFRGLEAGVRLANLLGTMGRFAEAEQLRREFLETLRRVDGEEHERTLIAMHDLAVCLAKQGRYSEAHGLHDQALKIQRRVLGEDHPDTLLATEYLAGSLAYQGRFDESESFFREALNTRRRSLGDQHPDVGQSFYNLACLFAMQLRTEEGLMHLRQAAEHGFTNAAQAAADPDLEGLRDEPDFQTILAGMRKRQQDGVAATRP